MDRKAYIIKSIDDEVRRHKARALDADPITRMYHVGAVDALEPLIRSLGFWLDQMESDAVIRGMDRADVIWKRETDKARAIRG
jgi:hypothetical protein